MNSFETGSNSVQPVAENASIAAARDYIERYPKILNEYPGIGAHGDIIQMDTTVDGKPISVFNPHAFGISELLSKPTTRTQKEVKKGVDNIKFSWQRKLGHIAVGGGSSGTVVGAFAEKLTDLTEISIATGLFGGFIIATLGTLPFDKNQQYKKSTKAIEDMVTYFADENHGGIWFYRSEGLAHHEITPETDASSYLQEHNKNFIFSPTAAQREEDYTHHPEEHFYVYDSMEAQAAFHKEMAEKWDGKIGTITILPGLLVETILARDARPDELWQTDFGDKAEQLAKTHHALKALQVQQLRADAFDTFSGITNVANQQKLADDKAYLDATLLRTSLEMIDIHAERMAQQQKEQQVARAEEFLSTILGAAPKQNHPHEMILQDVYSLAAKAIAELDISSGDTHAHATELGHYLKGMRTHLAEEQDLPQLYQGLVLKFSGHFPGLLSWDEAKQTSFGKKFP